MSPKQTEVMKFFADHEYLTINQAVELIGKNIYHNASFHVGNVLSNMVKRGMIRRVKRGVFALPLKSGEPKTLTLSPECPST